MRLWFLLLTLLLTGRGLAQLPVYDPARDWTLVNGQKVSAALMSFDGGTMILRLASGQRWEMTPDQLTTEDRAYLTEWQRKQPLKAEMPDLVGVDSNAIKTEVVFEDERRGKFIYRTEHFEFESEGKFTTGLLREVGRNFEATYELVKALPWGIGPVPADGKYFKARLFRTMDAYHEAGGPPGSGGVYQQREAEFLVPFSSIGLKVVGKSYAPSDNYDTHTMVHELTHEMMNQWLTVLPQWVIEGTAEYTSILPLKNGRFRLSAAKNGLKDYLDFLKTRSRGIPTPFPLEELFTMSNERWNQILATEPQVSSSLYFTAYLLVYYFMELDGKGDRQLFLRYFREIGEVQREVLTFREAVEALKKTPGVEVLPNGNLKLPDGVVPPEVPAVFASEGAMDEFHNRMLKILLNGRTQDQLMKEIRSAYMRLGVKL